MIASGAQARMECDGFLQCLAHARSGSRHELGELLQSFRHYLLRIAAAQIDHRLRGKLEAADAVQQTFLKAQAALHQFSGHTEEEFRAWLRQILVYEIGQASRQFCQTAKRDIRLEVAATDLPTRDAAQLVTGSDETPSKGAAANEVLARFDRALAQLPEEYRRVIELRNASVPFGDIGRLMGRSSGATQKLWARAVEKLRESLGLPNA